MSNTVDVTNIKLESISTVNNKTIFKDNYITQQYKKSKTILDELTKLSLLVQEFNSHK